MRIARGISIANVNKLISTAIAYDADATAFFTAASITDTTQKSAVNTLVLSLKSANIWTKMKALYPVVGGVASSHAVNLKQPGTFNLSFATGWTHSSTGMTPNGATYANTNIIPSSNLLNFNAHLTYYSRTNNTFASIDIGSASGTGNYFIQLYSSVLGGSRSSIQRNDTDYAIFGSANRLGLFHGNITANNSEKIFQNGILRNTNTTTDLTNRNSTVIYLGALNSSGTEAAFTNRECAFSSIGDGLTDAEALSLYNAVQAYQTTLGRQV